MINNYYNVALVAGIKMKFKKIGRSPRCMMS